MFCLTKAKLGLIATHFLLTINLTYGVKKIDRIEGGNVQIGPLSFHVGIFIEGQLGRCSGALISPRVVLTAGHCLVTGDGGRRYTSFELLFGETDLDAVTTVRNHVRVSNVSISHPNFRIVPTLDYDFGLIILEKNLDIIDYKTISTIGFVDPGYKVSQDSNVTISGWGLRADGTLDKRLKYATIRVVSRKCCLEFYSLYNLSPGVFCTLGMDGYICKGDSGSPVYIYENNVPKLIGIVSGGDENCTSFIPVLVTEINEVRPYLQTYIDKYENES